MQLRIVKKKNHREGAGLQPKNGHRYLYMKLKTRFIIFIKKKKKLR